MICQKCGIEFKSLVNDKWCKYCYDNIDKSEWKVDNPKVFEYDSKNDIVDVFIREDPRCPFPFHWGDWYHQGFYLWNFIDIMKFFFEKNNLPYEIVKK